MKRFLWALLALPLSVLAAEPVAGNAAPAAATAPMVNSGVAGQLTQLVFGLLLVLGLIFFLAWLLRRVQQAGPAGKGQVIELIGSRAQIVVKPIGQQFSNVGVIAGATILGDGQVCLILDGQSIARQIQATQRVKRSKDQRDLSRHGNARRLVMIVDDSVTVRKVTSRLLERQGYDIVTAKDGVDAIEQLENVRPDLMLLDIEMPRMDGFEVTNLVRHHDIHQDLPIIMITSRTGEKHRERAFSLGVTHYMGKPFQEAELLANIESLIAEKQE